MSVTMHEGKTFNKMSFEMDDHAFLNCVLKECDLFYSGGDLDFLNCQMENCRWHFRGAALKTMQFAGMFGMLKTSQIPPQAPVNPSKMN